MADQLVNIERKLSAVETKLDLLIEQMKEDRVNYRADIEGVRAEVRALAVEVELLKQWRSRVMGYAAGAAAVVGALFMIVFKAIDFIGK